MKVIITGATGLVGSEAVRLAARMPEITSVIALARKPVELDGPEASKVKSVVIKDYFDYPDHVKKELAGADACIWTVAVTPNKAMSMDAAEVKRVCHDATFAGLEAMLESGVAKPFRFLYMSGHLTERDQSKRPWVVPEYLLMRGATETQILDFAKEHGGRLEVCIAKPGIISSSSDGYLASTAKYVVRLSTIVTVISTVEVSRAMLGQVVHGFEKDTLSATDLVRLGS